ncbi:MAG TPA: hypothetical protein QGF63_01760 [Alphaproteobacteria bacterium]|jgi:hypothetical protein|nr:hypothetical protein [Alphaproteobacteria bacterium]MDP6270220.1 hypothetical protein [Alphaproteobacteria bacterium]MDP7165097.1 hypothetical protein [Alphaproteobacteria bacterium]MDP7427887.1 hypothetical protein [Alphaproteobacteria bacterium]HJM48552.1 hypothetical protein [Alphaproteobacteria bacterium]|tara:strand:- start:936 stop:1250 length:315 start_codon:yes stop_codon:yes gene_type:complete
MPVVALVRFPLTDGIDLDEAKEKFLSSTGRYCGTAGIVRKHYLITRDRKFGGAVYVFEDQAAADRVHDEAWVTQIKERYGVEPQVEYLDNPVIVDNEKGEVLTY